MHGSLAASLRDNHHPRRHILPDHDPNLIAPVIPPVWLDLDVLADHVEPHVPGDLNIVLHRLIRRRSVQPVGPPALIERAEMEQGLVVEEHDLAVGAVAEADLAHSEVALELVERLIVLVESQLQIVQKRLIGRPKFGVVNIYANGYVGPDLCRCDLPAVIEHGHIDKILLRSRCK